MNEMLTKPMSVLRHEFIEQLIDDINKSQLPLFVIEPILQNLLNEVKVAAQKQYELDKAKYEQQLQIQNEISSNE